MPTPLLVAECFISPIFSLPLAKAVIQTKLVCTACDRMLAIERLRALTARTDECFNTYKSRGEKNRARGDHSRVARLDMLIPYQLATAQPDVEVSRIQAQSFLQRGGERRWVQQELSEVLSSSTTQIPAAKTLHHIWKLNLNPLVKKTIGGSGQEQLPWFNAGGELALLLTFLNGNPLLGSDMSSA